MSGLGHDPTMIVPPELLQQFFWGCTFAELQPLLRVCRRWRTIAMNHRNYWEAIDLYSTSVGALNSFLLRIERTHSRPFSACVWIDSVWEPMETHVVPALAAHLGRIVTLDINLNRSHGEALLAALRLPAPLLRTFHVYFDLYWPNHACGPVLPSDLFAGAAPALQTAGLINTFFPDPVPLVFAQIRTLVFGASGADVDDLIPTANIFPLFPQLRDVTFIERLLLLPENYGDSSTWKSLERVSLKLLTPCLAYAVRDLPLSFVPDVQLYRATAVDCHTVVGHLRDSLELAVRVSDPDPPCMFLVHLQEHASLRRRRTFMEDWTWWREDKVFWPHDLFNRADIASRLVSVAISSVFWHDATKLLLPLPNVFELHLIFEPDASSELPASGCVLAPRLREVTMQSEAEPRTLQGTNVRQFWLRALPETTFPIVLILENVLTEPCGEPPFPSVTDVAR